MGKRNKKRGDKARGKQRPRQARAERQQRRAAAESILRTTRSQLGDIEPALSQMGRMLAYSEWVTRGRPDGLVMMPPIYCRTGEAYWPEAVDYALQNTYAYVARALDMVPWSELVESLSRRAAASDPDGRDRLDAVLQDSRGRFERQYREAEFTFVDALVDDPEVSLRRALQAYAALYEVDLPLWYLGVLAKAHVAGRLDPGFLGGPDGQTAQGAMVNEIQPLLAETPLALPFSLGYDPVLRNAIGHNDCEIIADADGMAVRDGRTGTAWPAVEIHQRLMATSFMAQAIRLAVRLNIGRTDPPPRDAGALTFTCDVQNNNIPLVVIGQLAAFRDLDPDGGWIDSSTLTLGVADGVVMRIGLTDRAFIEDTTSLDPHFVDAVEEHGWVEVVRLPLAPSLGLELPEIKTASDESFEIVGPPDRHFIPISLVTEPAKP